MQTIVKLLLIEDDKDDQYIFLNMLKSCAISEFCITTVSNIAELYKLDTECFDLLILDLMLPDSAGIETLEHVRAHAANKPLIVLTGIDSDELGELAVENGAQDYLAKSEITQSQLIKSIRYALERHKLIEQLHQQASTDSLTSLKNRAYFFNILGHELKNAERYEYKVAVVAMDLDGFKEVNDRYGHPMGDKVLKTFATEIDKITRKSDIAARLGGDEFAFLLTKIDNFDQLKQICKIRIKPLCENISLFKNGSVYDDLKITVSIGVAVYPDHASSLEELMSMSDKSLYLSKTNGKNQIHIYDEKF